jgi:hypothetical protein
MVMILYNLKLGEDKGRAPVVASEPLFPGITVTGSPTSGYPHLVIL